MMDPTKLVTFEEWWEKQVGDNLVSDRIGCEFSCLRKEAKELFREAYLVGLDAGVETGKGFEASRKGIRLGEGK